MNAHAGSIYSTGDRRGGREAEQLTRQRAPARCGRSCIGAVRRSVGLPIVSPPTKETSQRGNQTLDALVARLERVLAEHGALGLVVELEVDPVDGVVALAFLGALDERTAQARTRRLRRRVDG